MPLESSALIHSFFYKNTRNFPEPQLFHCLFLNFNCSLAILSLNMLIKFILKRKKSVHNMSKFGDVGLNYMYKILQYKVPLYNIETYS